MRCSNMLHTRYKHSELIERDMIGIRLFLEK